MKLEIAMNTYVHFVGQTSLWMVFTFVMKVTMLLVVNAIRN